MGPDLTSKRWIIAKGILFALLAIMSGTLLVLEDRGWTHRLPLLLICVWASCRFYYFLFHVLHAYVDPTLPSASIIDLLQKVWKGRR